MRPVITLIVARAQNGVIGRDNALPWKLSNDLRFFRLQTTGKAVIMGRKTYDSIGKPLPNRLNIVVTRSPQWNAEGVLVAHSLEDAIDLAFAAAEKGEVDTQALMIMGGAELYQQAMPLAGRLIVTEVLAAPTGDAFLSAVDAIEWQEVSREHHLADDKNEYPHDFVVYERRLMA
ncbi:MAG: dihydrofolate reductase [Hahellaceae bacterium]|nr:dihydrofolate reductase [Hahellaceae bacterium]